MSSSVDDSPIEEIVPGLTRQWIRGGKIVVFTLMNSSRELTDAWFEAVLESYQQCPPGQPYLSVQDLSTGPLAVTPYGRKRITELTKLYPELYGRTAVLVLPSLFGQVMQGILRVVGNRKTGRSRRIFFKREEAMRWLEELIP